MNPRATEISRLTALRILQILSVLVCAERCSALRLLLCFTDTVVLALDTVVAEFVAEGADADAEELRGVGAVLIGLFERDEDVALLDFGEGS